MTIPSQIEQDVISGKAVYRTAQFGVGGQNILPVGQNQRITIFGYVFNPAGSGLTFTNPLGNIVVGPVRQPFNGDAQKFMCQQILIWTGNDFYPFVENIAMDNQFGFQQNEAYLASTIKPDAKVRSTYIQANQDVSFAVMLCDRDQIAVQGSIPVTAATPPVLSWGGTNDIPAVQTNLGFFSNQFLQPEVDGWDRPPYSYGLIPANAQGQYFHSPQQPGPAFGAGPYEPSVELLGWFGGAIPSGCNYKLQIHYALYNNPEN